MLDLNAAIREIVHRSFPNLRNMQISSRLMERADDFLAGMHWTTSIPRTLILSFSTEDVEQMPDAALVGCLVHELCHAEYDLAISPTTLEANERRYASDPEYRSVHEREIDLAVIKKGYGQELLALQTYHNQHYEAYGPSDGLTPEETQEIIRRITDR